MKQQLRYDIKAQLNTLSEKKIEEKSQAIQKKTLEREAIKMATTIGLFYGSTQEVQTHQLITQLLENKKTIALPRIHNQHLIFHTITDLNFLEKNKFGILEPIQTSPIITPEELDVILIPCLAVDVSGNRLGRGKGYYDRYLTMVTHATKVCLAFDCQIIAQVPTENHDEKIDLIVTESKIIDTKKKSNKFLYGKPIANKILERTKQTIKTKNIRACLAVILVGNDPASHLYVSKKKKHAKNLVSIAQSLLLTLMYPKQH